MQKKVKRTKKVKKNKDKTYDVEVSCTNCHCDHYVIKIPQGVLANSDHFDTIKCRACGCFNSLRKY